MLFLKSISQYISINGLWIFSTENVGSAVIHNESLDLNSNNLIVIKQDFFYLNEYRHNTWIIYVFHRQRPSSYSLAMHWQKKKKKSTKIFRLMSCKYEAKCFLPQPLRAPTVRTCSCSMFVDGCGIYIHIHMLAHISLPNLDGAFHFFQLRFDCLRDHTC